MCYNLYCRVAVEIFPILAVHPHTSVAHLPVGQETHSFMMWSFCSRERRCQCCHIIFRLVDPHLLVETRWCVWKGLPQLPRIRAPAFLPLHDNDFHTTCGRVVSKEKWVCVRRCHWDGDNIFGDEEAPNAVGWIQPAARWLRQTRYRDESDFTDLLRGFFIVQPMFKFPGKKRLQDCFVFERFHLTLCTHDDGAEHIFSEWALEETSEIVQARPCNWDPSCIS